MFNRKTCGIAFAGALAMCAGSAMASDLVDYASVQLGNQTVSPGGGASDLSNTAAVFTAGKEMAQYLPGLAAEGELTKSISSPSKSTGGVSYDADVTTLAAYGVYKLGVTPDMDIRFRGGVRWASVTAHASGPAGSASATDTSSGATYGVGATYAFNKNSHLQAEYTALSSDVHMISAGVQFRF